MSTTLTTEGEGGQLGAALTYHALGSGGILFDLRAWKDNSQQFSFTISGWISVRNSAFRDNRHTTRHAPAIDIDSYDSPTNVTLVDVQFVDNAGRWLDGKDLVNVVDKAKGYVPRP